MLNSENRQTPFWIWLIALALLQSSSLYSIFFLYTPGTADVYLTFSVGVILIYWLGPKTLILFYINAVSNCYFWGHENLYSWLVFAIPETTFFFLSWWLFIYLGKGKFWLPDLGSLVKFLLLGISVPLSIYMILLKYVLAYFDELEYSEIWTSITGSWLGDFMPTIMVSLPILYYGSKLFFQWMKWKNDLTRKIYLAQTHSVYIEVLVISLLVILLSIVLDFTKYWYLFGLLSLIVSVRHGFGPTTLVNLFILIVIYFIPATFYNQTSNLYFDQNELLDIYLGINLLALFSIICGRVISDHSHAQKNIRIQMEKVEQINTELDRFVYSVSHDLIAPLKSIKGLINLIKTDTNKDNSTEYITRIEDSADKLEEFIGEILDYSRSTRKEVSPTKIDLEQLIKDNISNHRFIEGFDQLNFNLNGLLKKKFLADEMRLKIILNNLISNAIKFSVQNQKTNIQFHSQTIDGTIEISVEDNGIGIPSEHQDQVFDMFFRASNDSSGSGLGLFIAREAARSMKGSLKVESREGLGSKFILTIPA